MIVDLDHARERLTTYRDAVEALGSLSGDERTRSVEQRLAEAREGVRYAIADICDTAGFRYPAALAEVEAVAADYSSTSDEVDGAKMLSFRADEQSSFVAAHVRNARLYENLVAEIETGIRSREDEQP